MKELLEKTVHKVELSKGEEVIVFHTSKWNPNKIVYETEASCCSETWFADIVGLHNLLGQEVIGVRVLDVEIPEGDTRTRQDEDCAYGYRISTKKGDCDFIFRNSSNGSYSGSIRLAENNRVLKLLSTNEFVEITDNDWSA